VPYWGSFVENVPLRYIDPTGHQEAAAAATWEWVVGGGALLGTAAPELAVAAPVVAGGVGIAGIGLCEYYGAMWVMNGPLGPDYPLPEEFVPGAIGATYPLPAGSTLTTEMTEGQAAIATESSTLGLDIPDLESQASVETYALEFPTVLEAGKNTPVHGDPWRRRKLPDHNSKPVKTQPFQQEPPSSFGPPKWPPDDWKDTVVMLMYILSQLADDMADK
jgi:hypothetical protein